MLLFLFIFLFFLRQGFALSLRLECSGMILAHWNLSFRFKQFPASVSQVAGITGTHHQAWLIFVFSVELGFHQGIHQAGLEFLALWSTCLGLSKCWDYRYEPPHLAFSNILDPQMTDSIDMEPKDSVGWPYMELFPLKTTIHLHILFSATNNN